MQGIFRNSEFVVFGYRGPFNIPFKGRSIPAAFNGRTGGHSKKPSEFYELLRTKTKPPRIDVFARKRHPGFDAWGDEAVAHAMTDRLDASLNTGSLTAMRA